MPNDGNNSSEQSNEKVQKKKSEIAQKIGEKVINKASKGGAKSAVQKKAINLLLRFAPVIGIALIVILVIIMIIGLIAFFMMMPGLLADKLSGIYEYFKDISATYENGIVVDEETVIKLAQYIEDMDYDLVGYGFVNPVTDENYPVPEVLEEQGYHLVTEENPDYIYDNSDDKSKKQQYLIFYENDSGQKYDKTKYLYYKDGKLYSTSTGLKKETESKGSYEKYGITYTSGGKVESLNENTKTSVLRTYALAEKRLYVMRNILYQKSILQRIVANIRDMSRGYSNAWAQGMLEFWEADDGVATKMYDFWGHDPKSSTNFVSFLINTVREGFEGHVTIIGTNKIEADGGWFNNPMIFDMQGWTGRYGLSTDFLISLHLATLSPELVTTICQSFDIRAQIYLDQIKNGKMEAYYHTKSMVDDNGEDIYANYNDLDAAQQDSSWNPFDGWFLSKEEAKKIMKEFKIESVTGGKYACQSEDPSMVLAYYGNGSIGNKGMCYSQLLNDGKVSWREDVIYNQWSDGKNAWISNDNRDGNGIVCVRKRDYDTLEELNEKWDDEWDDYVDYLQDGTSYDRPGVLMAYVKGEGPFKFDRYEDNRGIDNNEVKLGEWCNTLDDLNNIYNQIISDKGKYNIVSKEDKGIMNSLTVFDESSDYYMQKYMSYSNLRSMGEDDKDWYEVECAVWPTNDDNLVDGDAGYDSDKDGELILSLLIRKTTKDKNYDFSWILYRNYSVAEAEEKGFDGGKTNSSRTCFESDKKEACANCRRYVKDIIKALGKINDEKFKTHVPYISRVVGSWYRDTYFTLPDSPDSAIREVYNAYDEYKEGDLLASSTELIADDKDFLEATGELWTEYVMDDFDYNYALFVINSDGSYLESEADIENWKNKQISLAKEEGRKIPKEILDSIGSIKKYNPYKKEDITYYGYIDVYPGISDKSELTFETSKYMEDLFTEYEIAYIKHPVTQMVDSSGGWSAYKFDTFRSDYKPLYVSADSPNVIRNLYNSYNQSKYENEKDYEPLFYYIFDGGEKMVAQVKDAYRGMTNTKIKYLFKNRKYYKYDGTMQTTFHIKDDKAYCLNLIDKMLSGKDTDQIIDIAKNATKNTRITNNHNIYRNDSFIGALIDDGDLKWDEEDRENAKEDIFNAYIDCYYYHSDVGELKKIFGNKTLQFVRDFDDDKIADIASPDYKNKIGVEVDGLKIVEKTKFTYDPRNPNLVSNIDLSKDGLAAFSILENTHTADADYAYRDFKELVCELDYFDKEDLIEPPTNILEWILPESGSMEWPERKYDKTSEYGTTIHSTQMYSDLNGLINTAKEQTKVQGEVMVPETTEYNGFSQEEAVVSPATAKVIEMGTTTVNNETAEEMVKSLYVVRDDENSGSSDSDDETSPYKVFVTQEQKEIIEEEGNKLKDDPTSTFGKSYTTGYIKLEVIGKESLEKITNYFGSNDEIKDGINAFYEEYYNTKLGKTICDSFTIYIEGIDFRLDRSEGASWEFENTILNKIITENATEININPNDVNNPNIKQVDNYTSKEIPKYYPEAKQDEMKANEEIKNAMPNIINFNDTTTGERQLYIKAGTLIGVSSVSNITIIMKDKDYAIVENVENYLEVKKAKKNVGGSGDGSSDTGVENVVGGEISASQFGPNGRTEDEILIAIASLPESMQENALSMLDGLKRMQSDFDIDPLVALALFRGETSMGTYGLDNFGQYRLDNHQHWELCQCNPSKQDPGDTYCCYDNFSDNAYDWGNYVHNRFGAPLKTWDELATGPDGNMIIYENCNVDDGGHAISFYKELCDAVNASKSN